MPNDFEADGLGLSFDIITIGDIRKSCDKHTCQSNACQTGSACTSGACGSEVCASDA